MTSAFHVRENLLHQVVGMVSSMQCQGKPAQLQGVCGSRLQDSYLRVSTGTRPRSLQFDYRRA